MLQLIASLIFSLVAEACCWYHCFRLCGCIDNERYRDVSQHAAAARANVTQTPRNPFRDPASASGVPEDLHLQQAYV